MKIEHISVSRAETYQRCPLNYKYRYDCQIKPAYSPFYFTFGKIVHKIIELYTSGKGTKDIREAEEEVLSGKVELEPGKVAPPLDFEQKQRLNLHLVNFMKLTKKIGCDGEVEWAFSLDLDPPHNKHWVGFIDRLIQKQDKYFIIDFKTTKPGKWRKDKLTIRKDLQIQGYCHVIRHHFKVSADKVRAALYYLEDGLLVDSGYFSDQFLDLVPQNLLKMYNNIQLTDPNTVVGKTGDHCFRCEYNNICPFYKEFRTGMPLAGYNK